MGELEDLRKENESLKREIQRLKSLNDNRKKGMIKKASSGNVMSRAPFGYKLEGKTLVPAQNYKEVEEIFEQFLNDNLSLRQLAEKHHLSVNGLKKILKNLRL